ncbi:MAG: hypothetical protein HQ594_06445 [Candidatus Omnitrophica bacterium]|nr:hypothetical protein [Candidatus Omnitrophota bacterium]
MKKKHLQACEMGGSLYGKKQAPDKNVKDKGKSEAAADPLSTYSKLYRKQMVIMKKVYHQDK